VTFAKGELGGLTMRNIDCLLPLGFSWWMLKPVRQLGRADDLLVRCDDRTCGTVGDLC
jgi:hypothetical protein